MKSKSNQFWLRSLVDTYWTPTEVDEVDYDKEKPEDDG